MVDFMDNAENRKPMREGCAAHVLLQPALAPGKQRSETERALDRLNAQLAQLNLNSEGDAMKAYCDYIRTLKALYPAGGAAVNEAIYDACMYFVENADQRYANDARLLDLFIQLADKQQQPRDVFLFMQDRAVCVKLPKFHLALASVYERQKDFDKAGQSYQEAVYVAEQRSSSRKSGEATSELDLANLHLAHYKRRMARRQQEARAIHGPRSPEANKLRSRPPMAPRGVAAAAGGGRVPAALQQQQPMGMMRKPTPATTATTATNQQKQPNFAIYSESAGACGGGAPASAKRPLEAKWRTLTTDSQAVENLGPAQPWTAAGPLTAGTASSRAPKRQQQPAFAIFHEEEEEEQQQSSVPFTPAPGSLSHNAAMEEVTPAADQDDRTINSQLAFNDMRDIFGGSPGGGEAEDVDMMMVMATPLCEGENVSPNVLMRMRTTTTTTTDRRPPLPLGTAPRTAHHPHRSAATVPMTTGVATTGRRRPVLAVIEHDEDGVSPSFRRELHFPSAKPQERFQVFREQEEEEPDFRPTRKAATHRPTPGRHRPAAAAGGGLFLGRSDFDDEQEEEQAAADDEEEVTYDGGTFGISRVLAFDAPSAARPTAAARNNNNNSARMGGGGGGGFAVFRDD